MGAARKRTVCVGCGSLIEGFQSPYGICWKCSPTSYNRKSETEVSADPQGRYKISEPLPGVTRPSAIVVCKRSKLVAVFDPREVGVFGLRPFRTYEGVHPSVNGGVLAVVTPPFFIRLWHALSWRIGLR